MGGRLSLRFSLHSFVRKGIVVYCFENTIESKTYDAVVEVGAAEDGGHRLGAQEAAAQLCYCCLLFMVVVVQRIRKGRKR